MYNTRKAIHTMLKPNLDSTSCKNPIGMFQTYFKKNTMHGLTLMRVRNRKSNILTRLVYANYIFTFLIQISFNKAIKSI